MWYKKALRSFSPRVNPRVNLPTFTRSTLPHGGLAASNRNDHHRVSAAYQRGKHLSNNSPPLVARRSDARIMACRSVVARRGWARPTLWVRLATLSVRLQNVGVAYNCHQIYCFPYPKMLLLHTIVIKYENLIHAARKKMQPFPGFDGLLRIYFLFGSPSGIGQSKIMHL